MHDTTILTHLSEVCQVRKRLRIMILEDEIDRYPRNQIKIVLEKHELTIAKSCDEGIEKFVGPYDLLLLDHDMEGDYEYRPEFPNTGYQFVKWLVGVRSVLPLPQVILHSHNPVGRARMRDLLHEHDFSVDECYFGPDYIKQLKEQLG